ncbi:MAG: hypothetical protein EOO20_08390 [Chryseobacterium sp.]|nr:MAG: hypothetical protein EOO20_08390 [Chryseobacterium sp.]
MARRKDPFDYELCIGGLVAAVINLHSHHYEFCYYLSFKRAMREYTSEFTHPWNFPVPDGDFFDDVDDPIVQHSSKAGTILIEFNNTLMLRHGLHDGEVLEDEAYEKEVTRFLPAFNYSLHKKAYSRLLFMYERFFEESINTLYYYACTLSMRTYDFPTKMRLEVDYIHPETLRYLNIDDPDVALLVDLITELQGECKVLYTLTKGKKTCSSGHGV